MIDKHYTSVSLAEAMIAALPKDFSPRTVADFAAGPGGLIDAALSKWKNLEIIANDLCKNSAYKLRKKYPQGIVSCCNFLKRSSIKVAKFAPKIGKLDLILINPPFSQRGAN